ncbi:hypothetical protein [Streptomyces sp. NPDC001268]|uniref:hypothetical protein n=1 Tax=Streptomyces sp. NPDC001268 TaxID=3364553 RepID=UPI0036788986
MTALLMTLELVCVAAVVAGVALWSVPAAMVLGGVLGVVAVERAQAGRKGAKT